MVENSSQGATPQGFTSTNFAVDVKSYEPSTLKKVKGQTRTQKAKKDEALMREKLIRKRNEEISKKEQEIETKLIAYEKKIKECIKE